MGWSGSRRVSFCIWTSDQNFERCTMEVMKVRRTSLVHSFPHSLVHSFPRSLVSQGHFTRSLEGQSNL